MSVSLPSVFSIGQEDIEGIHDDARLLAVVQSPNHSPPPAGETPQRSEASSSDEAATTTPLEQHRQEDGGGTLSSGLSLPESTATRDYMGMPQLNFASSGLVGRDHEKRVLRDAYGRVSKPESPGKSELCLVHGVSGIGKSSLVETLRLVVTSVPGTTDGNGSPIFSVEKPIQEESTDGYFVEGKFEQMRQASPYSALNAALTDLCDLLLQSTTMSAIRARIGRNLQKADIKTLSYLVPNLGRLMGETGSPQDDLDDVGAAVAMAGRNEEPVESGRAFTRFKVLVRRFLSAVASPKNPLVMFLDDVQWADRASMEIIDTLTKDKDSRCLLLVLCYRDDDASLIEPIEELKSNTAMPVMEMHITELNSDDVNDMLSTLLQRDRSDTLSLAELIIRKTSGNAHHVVQFLKVLSSQGLLSYSVDDGRWIYNEDTIRAETNVETNVVALVTERIGRLSSVTRWILMFASCLGFNFDVEILYRVVENDRLLVNFQDPPAAFIAAIKDGEREGLIEEGLRVKGDEVGWLADEGVRQEYKFTHDDVQKSLYDYFPDENDRDLLHGRIGELLKQLSITSEENRKDSLQFEATNQCNQAANQLTTYLEKVGLARMNTITAGIAVKQSAFGDAAMYYRTALLYLDQDRIWQTDYDLIFEILSSLCRMEFMLGRFDECREIVDEVVERATCLEDQIKVLRTQIESLGVQGDLPGAVRMGLETLVDLDEHFPKNPTNAHVMLTFIRLSSLLRNKSDVDLLTLPPIEQSDTKLLALRILRSVVLYSYFQESVEPMALGVMRMVELTIKHGNSVMAPFAYGMFAMVLSFLQRREQSYRFATLTLRLLRENPLLFQEAQPGGLGAVYCFAAHWRRKLVENRKYLMEAHRVGSVVGDFTCGSIGACATYNAAFFVTTSYPELYHEGRAALDEMEAFGQETLRLLTIPYCQAVDNLVGECDDPVRLTGEVMQEEEFIAEALKLEHKASLSGALFVRLMVTTVFCDWDLALEVMDELEPHTKTHVGHFNVCYYDFSRGLVWAGAYQKEKSRGLWRKFATMLKKLEIWSKEGVKVCTPLYLFLKAEGDWARNNVAEARHTFDLAIAACSDASYCLYEGLANERCGEMLLEKEHYAAEHYLSRAVYIYNEIGAVTKTDQVKRKHPSLFKEDKGAKDGVESFNFFNRNAYIFAEETYEGTGSETSILAEYRRKPSTASTSTTVSSDTLGGRNSVDATGSIESPTLRLHGRFEESDLLYKLYNDLCTVPTKDTTRCCLMHGPDGVGKTSLVVSLQQRMGGGVLISGKFDQYNQVSRPYGGFRQAMSGLCKYLCSNNSSTVRADIAKELRYESPTLMAFMPEMRDVFPEAQRSPDESSIRYVSLPRLIDALRSLMRMVATPSSPVVFFLDDLQWADGASLTIFEALIEDSKTYHVLYIGAYRDEGINDGGVALFSEKGKPWLKQIRLENLSEELVSDMVCDVVEREPSEVGDLGSYIHSKSQGNPCYAALFLRHLVASNLLRLETGSARRTWDCHEIKVATQSWNSVFHLLEAKIDGLEGRDVLVLASLLGYEFDISLLELILEEKTIDYFVRNPRLSSKSSATEHSDATQERADLKKAINEAISQDVLERIGHRTYRFKGNKIQEVLLAMAGSETQRSRSHFEIGKVLFGTENKDQSMIFDSCNHLNLGRTHLNTREDVFELARVNVEAAKLAVAAVGHDWASTRIKRAQLSVDREKKWAKDYEFSLDLCNLVALVELMCGNHVGCRLVVDEVSSHAGSSKVNEVISAAKTGKTDEDSLQVKSPKDRMSTALTQLKSFRAKGEFAEAQGYALEILGELGCSLKNPTTFNVWMDLVSTRWLVNPKTGFDSAAVPEITDDTPKEYVAAMEILASMVEDSFLTESSELFSLSSLQMLRLSVRHGISKYTALALACYGAIVMAAVGDVQEGYMCGEQALLLSQQFPEPVYRARTRFVVNLYLKHWRDPVAGCISALHDAYKEGKGCCDLGFSALAGQAHALLLFLSGAELHEVNTAILGYVQEFRYNNQTIPLLMIQPYLQLTHCLMDEADDPMKLDGMAMRKETFLADLTKEEKNIAIVGFHAAQLILCCFFGDVDGASSATVRLDEYDKTPLPHYLHSQLCFFTTWTKLQLARRDGHSNRSLVEARKDLRKLERFDSSGAVNLKAQTLLLKAEHAAVNGDNENAKTLFDLAAKAAESMKLKHYQAFSLELAGRHLLDAMDDKTQATSYLSRARAVWDAYGSTAKVQQLDETFQSLLVAE